jgi:hypothetical protein
MSSISKFVHGGGSISRQRFGRPKLRLVTVLAIAWSAVTAVPLWMLLSGTHIYNRNQTAFRFQEGLGRTRTS